MKAMGARSRRNPDVARRQDGALSRCIASVSLLFLIGSWHASARAEPACARQQQIQIDGRGNWRCKLSATSEHAYLVRVDRQRIDVALELLRSDGAKALRVNSPTLRSGPELLLLTIGADERYSLVVSPIDHRAPKVGLRLEIEDLAQINPSMERGLAALTASARASDKTGRADSEQRIARLQDAVRDFKAAGNTALESEGNLRIANIYYWTLGDWQKCADAALTAMRLAAQAERPIMQAHASELRALALIEIAQAPPPQGAAQARAPPGSSTFDEARRLLERAAATFRQESMTYEEAHALNSLGLAFFYQGMSAEARIHYERAARVYNKLGEVSSAAAALGNIAVLEYEQGNYASAAASFEAVRVRADPASDAGDYVSLLNNLAIAYYAGGRFDDALQALLTALPLTQGEVDPSHRARTLHGLGRVYLIVGNIDRAGVFLRQALELRRLESTHDRRGLLTSLISNGDLDRELGKAASGTKLHLEALEHAITPAEQARVLLAIGTDQILDGSPAQAIGTFDRALALDLSDEWPIKTSLQSALGQARMLSGDASGRELLLTAAAAHRAAGDNELAARNYSFLADSDYRAGKLESALKYCDQAVALYGLQRLGTVNPDLRATYVANRAGTHELQSAIYMSLRQRAERGARQEDMGLAALLSIESLRLKTIEDFRALRAASPNAEGAAAAASAAQLDARIAAKRFRLDSVLEQPRPSAERVAALRRELALLRSELDVVQLADSRAKAGSIDDRAPASLRQLQESVAPDTALLTWLPSEGRSWIWCITQERASAYALPGRGTLEEAARTLYAHWSNPIADADLQAERRLSRVLLGNATECSRDKQVIHVVTEGLLRNIPVGALWFTDVTGSERRIIERQLVSYRISLTSRQAGLSPSTDAGSRAILLVGDPQVQDQRATAQASAQPRGGAGPAYRDLRPLPGAARELAAIAALTKGWQSVSLVRERATRDAFLAESPGKFRIIHFATHALLDVHDPQLSALILSGGSALNLRDVMSLRLQTQAVVLGACEASLGKQYRGQLSLGLSEAFLLAGAKNVLGSLWPVSDDATMSYMQSFYQRYIQQGLTPPAAAQAAARELMQNGRYRHPFYWAAFVNLTT